jgi:hypothetical protein
MRPVTRTTSTLAFGLLWAASVLAASAGTPGPSATVVWTQGGSFDLARGTELYRGSRGVAVRPGDLIGTKPDGLVILRMNTAGPAEAAAVAAIGPSSHVTWVDGAVTITLALRSGWLKVDTSASAQGAAVVGPRLIGTGAAAVFVVHVGESVDEIFDESGSITLDLPDRGPSSGVLKPNEFASLAEVGPVSRQMGAAGPFVAALPNVFRDPLPRGIANGPGEIPPDRVREVTYDDVAVWLTAPRSWRPPFVKRFRPRVKDPAFRRSIEEHLRGHPEWQRILHPPPPADAMLRGGAPTR